MLVSVPHAGRHYPPALAHAARVPLATLTRLEDRYCDVLAEGAATAGFAVQVATHARAWIDLNRAESAWDAALVADSPPPGQVDRRVRAGLGLVPTQLAPEGPLWRERMLRAELDARIATLHRPWHEAIAATLTAMAARTGRAVLIDLHSMPTQPGGTPAIVIGDRFGQTASVGLIDRLTAIIEGWGLSHARNIPYAGAYAIERHGSRHGPIEAVQIEVDRALYLDGIGSVDGARATGITALVTALAEGAAHHCSGDRGLAYAAE